LPKTLVDNLLTDFPTPLDKTEPFFAVFADNESAPGLIETPFFIPFLTAASACWGVFPLFKAFSYIFLALGPYFLCISLILEFLTLSWIVNF
jgi:hypothetical protein